MSDTENRPGPEGLRERKRRETAARIVQSGLALFLAQGYDGTTVDEIAKSAGISRRTFFYYFDSKDDILLSLQGEMGEMLAAGLAEAPPTLSPLAAMRQVTIRLVADYPADEMLAIDRLMRSSPTVMARKQASYVEHERTLLAAMRERWPDPAQDTGLRIAAMLTIGVIRLSLETFNHEGGQSPLAGILARFFDAIEDLA